MPKRIVVSVCGSCIGERVELMAELGRLREANDRVSVADVDCLDACDRSPVVSVEGVIIAPATAEAVRAEVDRQLMDVPRPPADQKT